MQAPFDQENTEKILFNAARVLMKRGYPNAAGLLKRFPFEIYDATNDFNDKFNVLHATVPLEKYEELTDLASDEEGRHAFHIISEAISELGYYIRFIGCDLEHEEADPEWRSKDLSKESQKAEPSHKTLRDELIRELQAQRDLMIEVATGGRRIQDTNRDYEAGRSLLASLLQKFGLLDPSPFTTDYEERDVRTMKNGTFVQKVPGAPLRLIEFSCFLGHFLFAKYRMFCI